MKLLLLWIAAPLLLLGTAMLIAGIGASALWLAVIAVGSALVVVIGQGRPNAMGTAVTMHGRTFRLDARTSPHRCHRLPRNEQWT